VDQIQKVAVRIAKDIARLRGTTAAYDAIRSTDIPPTRPMLDRRTEQHFLRLLTQKNTNSDLIPQEPDRMIDEEDLPILDSWTERVAEDLWVLGDKTEQSVPVDLEFALWDEDGSTKRQDRRMGSYHGWTDRSRRTYAAFGWSLQLHKGRGKQVEVNYNNGSLGEFETAFDGEMEAIANIMEYVIDNEIPGDITIHSDAQAAIA
jgi:hypothetical protein